MRQQDLETLRRQACAQATEEAMRSGHAKRVYLTGEVYQIVNADAPAPAGGVLDVEIGPDGRAVA